MNIKPIFAALALFAGHAAAESITVTDNFDNTITLVAPAQRILSLGPHVTENLFSAGAGDKVVGGVLHADYPPAADKLPKIGSGHADVNLEAALALAPDLIAVWRTAGNADALRKFAEWGIPVYYSEPRSFEDILGNIANYARLVGLQPPPLVAELRDEIRQVQAQYAHKPKLQVFYQVWDSPLITLNGEHYISRVLEVCGAQNVFAELPIIAPRVSVESVLQANPDVIITGKSDGEFAAATAADEVKKATAFALWQKWKSLSAVRRDGFILADSDVMHRHSERMIRGIRGLCEAIDAVRGASLNTN